MDILSTCFYKSNRRRECWFLTNAHCKLIVPRIFPLLVLIVYGPNFGWVRIFFLIVHNFIMYSSYKHLHICGIHSIEDLWYIKADIDCFLLFLLHSQHSAIQSTYIFFLCSFMIFGSMLPWAHHKESDVGSTMEMIYSKSL